MNRLAIGVQDLRKGMYVSEPDRPWIEVPLPLQGFTIRTDEELKVLREHCKYVYIDPERCADSDNERELTPGERAGAGTKKGEAARKAENDDGIDELRRHVDTDKLRVQLEAASRTLAEARKFFEESFSGAYRGKGVDAGGAESAISELIIELTRNPTASLLLTSLNDEDSFTSIHSVHVCVLTLAFCLRTRIDRRKLEILGLGALLHDIGKTHLPKPLVNRPGPLTESEWRLVRHHPTEGQRILGDSGNFPRVALNIAAMHHERRDGSGYPKGLTREDLPDYLRVIALINRYESLTSARPYRPAAAPDQVLRSFYKEADRLYGSRPVEAFIRCVGIYPVGSIVELDNGALAVVVGSRPNTRLRPVVQLVRTPDGEPYRKLVLLNLAAEAERWERKDSAHMVRRVRRVRNPSETGIDPGAVIAEAFGVRI